MKQLLIGLIFSLMVSTAYAACPSTLELQDANNIKAPAKYTDDGSGNCQVNTAAQDGANVTLGSKADAAWVTGTGSAIAILKAIVNAVNSPPPSSSQIISLTTTGGWTPQIKTNILTSALAIKASGGWLGLVQCDNNNNAWSYLQIFNAVPGNVTLGATVPLQIVPIAPSLSNGFVSNVVGMQYSTAISVAASTTATGTTAPGTGLNCSFGTN